MKTVSFTRMDEGTFEDYQLLAKVGVEHENTAVDRVLVFRRQAWKQDRLSGLLLVTLGDFLPTLV